MSSGCQLTARRICATRVAFSRVQSRSRRCSMIAAASGSKNRRCGRTSASGSELPSCPLASSAVRVSVAGRPAQGCRAEVRDQHLGKVRAVAGDRHRQVEHQRLARLGLGAEPVAPVDLGQVQLDPRPARHDAVVVAGARRAGATRPPPSRSRSPSRRICGRRVGRDARPPIRVRRGRRSRCCRPAPPRSSARARWRAGSRPSGPRRSRRR